jgi:hypothetical protein
MNAIIIDEPQRIKNRSTVGATTRLPRFERSAERRAGVALGSHRVSLGPDRLRLLQGLRRRGLDGRFELCPRVGVVGELERRRRTSQEKRRNVTFCPVQVTCHLLMSLLA